MFMFIPMHNRSNLSLKFMFLILLSKLEIIETIYWKHLKLITSNPRSKLVVDCPDLDFLALCCHFSCNFPETFAHFYVLLDIIVLPASSFTNVLSYFRYFRYSGPTTLLKFSFFLYLLLSLVLPQNYTNSIMVTVVLWEILYTPLRNIITLYMYVNMV